MNLILYRSMLGGYFHFGNNHFLFLINRIFLSSCLFIKNRLKTETIT